MLGLFIGFVGVMVVMGVAGAVLSSARWPVWGQPSVTRLAAPWTRRFLAARPEGGPSLMGAQLLCSTLIMALACALWTPRLAQVLGTSVLAVVVLGALATGLAFIWMYRVVAGSVVSTSVTYATPVVSTGSWCRAKRSPGTSRWAR